MNITFLAADRALTKTYKKNPDGSIEATSYPNAYAFTSRQVSVSSLQQLATALELAGKKGECLLKGNTMRPLVEESRAGSTDATQQTEFAVLDVDGSNYPTPDAFMQAIGLGDVSYVAQYSASSGFKAGLRCHIYVLLSAPQTPSHLKIVLTELNLTKLQHELGLTRTGMSLRYPLDITACQNDKLIYIAPPVLDGLIDPHAANRIQFFQKTNSHWTVPATAASPEAIRHQVSAQINALRKRANLPEKKNFNTKMGNSGVEYMPNPGEAIVTGVRKERGFVYLNLNGGDSWGYWYPENSPDFLYNFKSEPTYKLSELCPSYWSSLHSQTNRGVANSLGQIYLGVCDMKSGAYHKIIYDTGADELQVLPARSKEQLKDFLKQHGQPVGDVIFDWQLVWEPNSPITLDFTNKTVNTFRPSEFMKMQPKAVSACPPTIRKLAMHVLGNDQGAFDYYMNWLAFIMQDRTRTNTAIVKFGNQGTGKGMFFHRVLTRIFGADNVVVKRMEELESDFTGFMDGKLIVFIDEIQVSRSPWAQKITAKLKNLIAEERVSVRRMYQEAYITKNHANFIFASNMRDPLEIAPGDRRFTIGTFQPTPIKLTEADLDLIDDELFDFYSFLMSYPVDREAVRKPHQNQERQDLIETSMLSVDVISQALNQGNLDFFFDQLPQNERNPAVQRLALSDRELKLQEYKLLLKELVLDNRKYLSRDDLLVIYSYCMKDVPESPNRFTSFLRHHDIRLQVVWNGNKSIRGFYTKWKITPTLQTMAQEL